MTTHRHLRSVALILLALTSPAGAATITEHVGSTDGRMDALPQFDPALGTLTGVHVAAQGESDWQAVFVGRSGALLTATLHETLTFVIGDDSLVAPTADGVRARFSGPPGYTSELLEGSRRPLLVSVSGDLPITPFVGTGTLPFTIESSSRWDISGGQLASFDVDYFAGGADITYTYTPGVVPEPASLAMLGTGLVGVGLVAVRRRTAASFTNPLILSDSRGGCSTRRSAAAPAP